MYRHHSSITILAHQLKGTGFALLLAACFADTSPYAATALGCLVASASLSPLHSATGNLARVSDPNTTLALLNKPHRQVLTQKLKRYKSKLKYNIVRENKAGSIFSDIHNTQAALFFLGTGLCLLNYKYGFYTQSDDNSKIQTALSFISTIFTIAFSCTTPLFSLITHLTTTITANDNINQADFQNTELQSRQSKAQAHHSYKLAFCLISPAASITASASFTIAALHSNATTPIIIGLTGTAAYLASSALLHKHLVTCDKERQTASETQPVASNNTTTLPIRFSNFQYYSTALTLTLACLIAQRVFYSETPLPFLPNGNIASSVNTTGSLIISLIGFAVPALVVTHFPNAPSDCIRHIFGDTPQQQITSSTPI